MSGRERLGFGLLVVYLLGFFLAPSSEAGQNVAHDAVFYFGLLPWALSLGLQPGLRAIRESRLLWLAVALVLHAAQFTWASVGFGAWAVTRGRGWRSAVHSPEVEGTVAKR